MGKKKQKQVINKIAVGKRLQEARLKEGLSQEEVGDMIDRNYRNISNAETGKTCPLELLYLFCKSTGTSMDYLLGLDGNHDPAKVDPTIAQIENYEEKNKKLLNSLPKDKQLRLIEADYLFRTTCIQKFLDD